jgi:hypothetical protein
LERSVEVTLDGTGFGKELDAWTVDGPWLLGMVVEAKEFLNLRMSGDAGSQVAATGLRVLLEETNIMAETFKNDAMHQSTKGTTDLSYESECWVCVEKLESTDNDDLHFPNICNLKIVRSTGQLLELQVLMRTSD